LESTVQSARASQAEQKGVPPAIVTSGRRQEDWCHGWLMLAALERVSWYLALGGEVMFNQAPPNN
jgi:hypothetical protein